jgi:UDP-N-acetylglucosamine 1-carboxyvinyltransferase
MGAVISGKGTGLLSITGSRKLNGVKNYKVIPDRIEAATLIAAAVITKGSVTVENIRADQMSLFFEKLREAGVSFEIIKGGAVKIGPRRVRLKGTDIATEPYPGFPTDIQAQWMAMMTLASGDTIIKENIWENRFMHVLELARMGAQIKIDGNTAIVTGVKKLSGASVMASDLRASAALILAGLAAAGETQIRRIYHLDRGYENLDTKLSAIGADIRLENEDSV